MHIRNTLKTCGIVTSLLSSATGGLAIASYGLYKVNEFVMKKVHQFIVVGGRLQNWPSIRNSIVTYHENAIQTSAKWCPRFLHFGKITLYVFMVSSVAVAALQMTKPKRPQFRRARKQRPLDPQ
jgi:hypothetical protein